MAEDNWILGSADATCPDSAILIRACNAAGFEPNIAFQSDDYNAIQGFIATGMGVSLIPDLALTTVRNDVVVRLASRGVVDATCRALSRVVSRASRVGLGAL
mgnify:CR=1 FL=1